MQVSALLGIRYPIIQAPMAGVSTPALAAAVSNAGGLGSVAVGHVDAAKARQLIADTRKLTSGPLNVNLFCHEPAALDPAANAAWLAHLGPLFAEFGAAPPAALREIYSSFVNDDEMLEMLLQERPEVVSFHFGLPPQDRIDALKQASVKIAATATSLDEAALLQAAGVDLIVAQGYEAGGHRGVFRPEQDLAIGTFALVRLIASKISLPVAAAGGIMDGQGINAALALGAGAVQLGTAFVLSPESSAPASYRALLKSERARHTQVTSAISGRPARGLFNRFMQVDGAGAPAVPAYPMAYDAGKALHEAASAKGSFEFAATWAGQGAPLAREMPAAKLVETLVQEMQQK